MSSFVIVDDHELLAEALRLSMIATGLDVSRVDPSSLPSLLPEILAAVPRVVLLDLDLGAHGDAIPLIAPLTAAGVRVLVVTGTTDRLRIAEAFDEGAFGVCTKSDGLGGLISAAVRARDAAHPADLETRYELIAELRRARAERIRELAPFDRLTIREQEALRAMGSGDSVTDMAHRWVVSETTVRSHVRGVLSKLSVRSQLGAVALALRTGWLDVERNASSMASSEICGEGSRHSVPA